LPIANGGTGSATQNFVDLTTAQTISGTKTFNDYLKIASTTSSTSTISGAFIVGGGVGIGGAIYAGSIQNTPIGSTTASTGKFTTLETGTLKVAAGTAAVGGAPIKLTAGVNLTTPEPGALEFDGTNMYFTNSSNLRQALATGSAGIGTLNTLTGSSQTFATGTAVGSGNDFNIASAGTTHTFNLPDASATARGVVTTGTQTFAGTKSFDNVSVAGALLGSTATASLSGFNAALVAVTGTININSANSATYNGKVLVCTAGPTITFDASSLPVGFSCMILQSDTYLVSFSGASNRFNYSATSGIYAIATAMCFKTGSVLLTGDLE
jgi:hypothetical protein